MPASVPPIVIPVMVMVLFVPIVLSTNVAAAPLWSSVTVSPVSIPTSAAEVFTNCDVATAEAL